MKKYFLITICGFLLLSINLRSQSQLNYSANTDSMITSIVSHVNSDSIAYVIQSLQDFQTRFALAANRFNVVDWIENRFYEIGITNVERDSFMCHTTYPTDTTTLQINIIGTITGTTRLDEVFIIGGHYDSVNPSAPYTYSPGADDNGSGTSAALEFARALIESGYQPEATIKFITFAAEEFMLEGDVGSEHYALDAKNEGVNIQLMVNCDMISYTTRAIEESRVRIHYYLSFEALRDSAKVATQQFSLLTPFNGYVNLDSDSYPFYAQGFPPVLFSEDDLNPYFHTGNDIISTCNMDYGREVIKAAGATLLKCMIQGLPNSVDEITTSPNYISLSQNYPNPFNPATKIIYRIPESSFVTLKVYDVLGNEVETLVAEEKTAGSYEIYFVAEDLPSGLYFYQLKAGSYSSTKKMLLLK